MKKVIKIKKKIIKVKKGNRRLKTLSLAKENCRTCYKFPCFIHSTIGALVASHSSVSNGLDNRSITNCQNWEGKTLKDYEVGKICPVCEGKGRVKKTIEEICNSQDYEEIMG